MNQAEKYPHSPSAPSDPQRLAALHRYEILDTPPEQAFDDITKLVAHVCQTPIAMISFVDERRQWLKSEVGLDLRQTPLEVAFCVQFLGQRDVVAVHDIASDDRLRNNPLVVGEPHVRFYAQMPLQSPEGFWLGALCVLDFQPRGLTDAQRDALQALARQVMAQLELRRAEAEARQNRERLAAVIQSALDCIVGMDHEGRVTAWNAAAERTFGHSRAEAIGHEMASLILSSRVQEADRRELVKYLATGERPMLGRQLELVAVRKSGEEFPVELTITRVGGDGPAAFMVQIRDLTERSRAEDARRMTEFRFQRLIEHSPQSTQLFFPDGRTRQVNRAFERLFGITQDQLLDYNILRDPELARLGMQPLIERAFAGEAVTIEPIPYVTDRGQYAGQTRWAGAYAYPVKDAAGRVEEVVLVHSDVTEQRRSEAALRASEGRFRFLSDLGELTREVADPEQVMVVVARALGEQLRVCRCAYAEVEADTDHFTIRHDYTNGCASTIGTYRLDLFGPRAAADQRAGRTLVIHDVDAELTLAEGGRTFNAIGIKAIVCCPLVRQDRLVAMMAVHQTTPRRWTQEEVALVEAVVERSWAYIERARAARAVVESEARFRLMADAIPQIVWVTDAEGRTLFFNRQWTDFTGVPFEPTTAGEIAAGFIHPDDRAATMDAFAEAQRTGGTFRTEHRIRSAAGEYHWFMVRAEPYHEPQTGQVSRWFGSSTDIHDRRQVEEALRESEQRFRQLADAMPQIVWVTRPDGHHEYYNRRWYEFTGVPAGSTDGEGWNGMFHPEDQDRAWAAWRHSLATGEPYEIEYRLRDHSGVYRWTLGRALPIRGDDGAITKWFGTCTDIDAIKRLQQEREHLLDSERTARAEAERASRMKDEFLATLSHELRTPLNAILGWSQILASGSKNPEDLAEGLQTIARNARAQTQIIEDLLDMSRIIAGKVRLDVHRIDLAPVLHGAIETVRPSAEAKSIRLHTVLDPTIGPVSGDPNRLQQVFWNLLTNAIKFTPTDGKVEVVMQRVNAHLEVSVIDNGEGISPEFLPHVFDRFRQADASTTRRHGGLGLGLSIVKQLVELHGGDARVKSAGVGMGATFTVQLPLAVIHPEPNVEGERRYTVSRIADAIPMDACLSLTGVKVLVVDDEPDARELVKRLLEGCQAVVVTAASADEAVQRVGSGRPDVLVSDIGMPGEDGYALIRRVRALGPTLGGHVPAVALTAYARAEDRMRAVLAGYQMHLVKPVEPAELITMVASLAGRTR